MNVEYHPEAAAEMTEAARYYEKRSPGLGSRLLDEIEAAVGRITEAPERWPLQDGGYSRYSIRVFPYFLAYRTTTDGIEILAVYHHSREPDAWLHRIDY